MTGCWIYLEIHTKSIKNHSKADEFLKKPVDVENHNFKALLHQKWPIQCSKILLFQFPFPFVFFSIRSPKKVYLRIDNKKSRKIDSANTHVEILISNREREEVFFRQNWNTYQVVVEWTRKAHSSSDLKSTYVDKFSFFYPLAQTHISLKYKTFFLCFQRFLFVCALQ